MLLYVGLMYFSTFSYCSPARSPKTANFRKQTSYFANWAESACCPACTRRTRRTRRTCRTRRIGPSAATSDTIIDPSRSCSCKRFGMASAVEACLWLAFVSVSESVGFWRAVAGVFSWFCFWPLLLVEGFVVVVAATTHDDELSAELWFMAFPCFSFSATEINIYEYFNFHLGRHPLPQAAGKSTWGRSKSLLLFLLIGLGIGGCGWGRWEATTRRMLALATNKSSCVQFIYLNLFKRKLALVICSSFVLSSI